MKIKNDLIIFFLLFLTCFFITYCFFMFPNWDFFSYHYYNGWAFLNNRLDIDFLPCMFRTYFNPYFDAIMFLIIQSTENNPFLFFLTSVIKLTLLFFFGYKITNITLLDSYKNKKKAIFFCIIMGILSPIIIMCNAIDNTDIPSGILCLIALYLYIKNVFNNNSRQKNISIFISLTIFGLTFGLKYTNFAYIIATFITSLILIKHIKKPLKTFFISFGGFFIGFSITGLTWIYVIYNKFKNPFFPYFNNIFKSPFADNTTILDSDFAHLKKDSFFEYIFMPLKNSLNELNVGLEFPYYDLKIILGFIVIISLFLILKNKTIKENAEKIIDIKILYFLLYFTTFAYYINLFLFGNYRYILVLFLIIPIFIYVCFSQIQNKILLNCLLLLVFWASLMNYHISGNSKVGIPEKIIEIQDLKFEDNSTVFCANFISAFVVPKQNKNVKYIGFILPEEYIQNGYFTKKNKRYANRYYSNKFLEEKIIKEIKESENLYIIFTEETLGPLFSDLSLYIKALNKYSNGNYNKLNNCNLIENTTFDKKYSINRYLVCKIK